MKKYEFYMKKCIKLAKKAEGHTSPNPLVGCVVLDKNGNEISCGFHKEYGGKHAEPDALDKLKLGEAAGGTLIVNLEPCTHFGKTPPCADLIIRHGLKRVVIGMKDPNPLVSRDSGKKLRNAGIEVIENVLYEEALKLNEVFVKNIMKKSVFVAIKTATTLDGKIATKTGSSKWITSQKSRKEVQKIRNRYDAILTTSSTIIKDNPSLECRLKDCKTPIKIILDRTLKTDFDSKIYSNKSVKIYVAVDEGIEQSLLLSVPKHIDIIKCPVIDSKIDIKFLLDKLFDLGIASVLVEGGSKINGELVALGLVDKIYQFIAPKIIADNAAIDAFCGRNVEEISDSVEFMIDSIKTFSSDVLLTLYKKDK